jgi:hypothetical protein
MPTEELGIAGPVSVLQCARQRGVEAQFAVDPNQFLSLAGWYSNRRQRHQTALNARILVPPDENRDSCRAEKVQLE